MPKGFPCENLFNGEESYYELRESSLLYEYEKELIVDWKGPINIFKTGDHELHIVSGAE